MTLKVGRTVLWTLLSLIPITGILLHSCISFRMSPREIESYFEQKHITATQHSYKAGFRELHYVKAGDATKPLILFLHGSPGSLSAFIHFLADSVLLKEALLITTDRPGFGNSNFGN